MLVWHADTQADEAKAKNDLEIYFSWDARHPEELYEPALRGSQARDYKGADANLAGLSGRKFIRAIYMKAPAPSLPEFDTNTIIDCLARMTPNVRIHKSAQHAEMAAALRALRDTGDKEGWSSNKQITPGPNVTQGKLYALCVYGDDTQCGTLPKLIRTLLVETGLS